MDILNPDYRDTTSVVEWLIDGARSAPEPHQVLAEGCERLRRCGIPLWRVAVFVRTLHPNIPGRAFVWRPGEKVQVRPADFELFESEEFRNSPVASVSERGVAIRRRLADPDCPIDFPVLRDFVAEGLTDYLASPLFFTDGTIPVVTWTTRAPGGFTNAHIAGLNAVLAPLALVAEVRVLHVGQVLYGNIGGGDRQDFTCIGPAVNLAARLEKLAGQLGRTVVASGDFAVHCPAALEPIGEFQVAGFSAAQTIFGLRESEAGRQ